MSVPAGKVSVLSAVADVAGYVAGFCAVYAGFALLEKIAKNTDVLIVRVDELETQLYRPTVVRPVGEPLDTLIPPKRKPRAAKSAPARKTAAAKPVTA